MSSAYEVKVVLGEELGDNLWAKGEGYTSVVLPPAHCLLVRVCPEQVTQQAWPRERGERGKLTASRHTKYSMPTTSDNLASMHMQQNNIY